jgi:hypothetical protein
MEAEVKEYPRFYRKAGHCLKRESATTTIEVRIPDLEKQIPLVHTPVTYPDKKRLDEEIAKMDEVDQGWYEHYLSMFFKHAEKNRVLYNAVKQKRFDSGGLVPAEKSVSH